MNIEVTGQIDEIRINNVRYVPHFEPGEGSIVVNGLPYHPAFLVPPQELVSAVENARMRQYPGEKTRTPPGPDYTLKRGEVVAGYESVRHENYVWRLIEKENGCWGWAVQSNDITGAQLLIPPVDMEYRAIGPHKGYGSVRVITQKGRPVFSLLGVNYDNLNVVNIPGYAWLPTDVYPNLSAEQQLAQVTGARALHARVVRLHASHRQFTSRDCAMRLRGALDILSRAGMFAIVCLSDFGSEFHHPDSYDSDGEYRVERGGLLNKAWFASAYRQSYRHHVTQVVTQNAHHHAVFAWEIMGNPRLLDKVNKPDHDDARMFATFLSDMRHHIASLSHHMIMPGVCSSRDVSPGTTDNVLDLLRSGVNIWGGCVHWPQTSELAVPWPHEDDVMFEAQVAARHKIPSLLLVSAEAGYQDRLKALEGLMSRSSGLFAGLIYDGFQAGQGNGSVNIGMSHNSGWGAHQADWDRFKTIARNYSGRGF